MLALIEVLPERLTKHRGVRGAGQITGDHGKDPGQRLQDGDAALGGDIVPGEGRILAGVL
jgi:hypothetical protein